MFFLFIHDRTHWNRTKVLMKQFQEERDSLLDRLMSRDFAQYKQAEVIEKQMLHQAASQPEEDEYNLSDVGV